MVFVFLLAQATLTAVSGDIASVTVKTVDREQAVVRTALAARELRVVFHV